MPAREFLALQYLRGEGIEIGALHAPLPVPPGIGVTYVDRFDVDGLRRHYPELSAVDLVDVDVVDDGESLQGFADGSLDFVIANHFLEHCENPVGALSHFLRVVKAGGVVYLAVPDATTSFERARPITTFEHLIADDQAGPERSRSVHYEEWTRYVKGMTGERTIRARVARYLETRYSIHFHTWTCDSFLEFLLGLRRLGRIDFAMEAYLHHRQSPKFWEMVAVLRRPPAAA